MTVQGDFIVLVLIKEGFKMNFENSALSIIILKHLKAVEIPCPDGYYQDQAGQTSCIECPENQSCEDKGATPQTCGANEYSKLGQMLCFTCRPGYNCGENKECALGQYSDWMTQVCSPCPEHFYCPTPNEKALCPPGLTPDYPAGSEGAHKCKNCPAGEYCISGENSPQDCPRGFYCPEGTIKPFSCPIGTYGATVRLQAENECTPCTAGRCCDREATTTPKNCPSGHFCPTGTTICNQFPCPAGTSNANADQSAISACTTCGVGQWCPIGSSLPLECPTGFFCDSNCQDGYEITCDPGMYMSNPRSGRQESDKAADCVNCGAGYYCPRGSRNYPATKRFPCPAGTFANTCDTCGSVEQFESEDQCTPCPAGTYCPEIAMATTVEWLNDNNKCNTGHFCPEGSVSPNEQACPAGTFNNQEAQTSQSNCEPCDEGFFCNVGTVSPHMPCTPGHFCPEGSTNGDLHPCPPGTYSPEGNLIDANGCTQCDAGHYCTGGKPEPDALCPPGYFCPAGSEDFNRNPCPAGTFQPDYGQTGQVRANELPTCIACHEGYFCEEASDRPIKCPFGTYMDQENNESKENCIECPPGSFCGTGTVDYTACALGFYSAAGWSECEPCLAGHYCDTEGTTELQMLDQRCDGGRNCEVGTIDQSETEPCPRGYVCPDGIEAPIACPPGTFNPDKEKSILSDSPGQSSDCLPCDAGYYCQEASWYVNVNFQCDKGFYCPNNLGRFLSRFTDSLTY